MYATAKHKNMSNKIQEKLSQSGRQVVGYQTDEKMLQVLQINMNMNNNVQEKLSLNGQVGHVQPDKKMTQVLQINMNMYKNVQETFTEKGGQLGRDKVVQKMVEVYQSITMCTLHSKYKKEKKLSRKNNIMRQMMAVLLNEQKNGLIFTSDEVDESKRLRQFVFRFYRCQFNKTTNSDNTILLHEAFELISLVEKDPDMIDSKRWISLIIAATQSGKTFLVIALSHIYTSIGYDSIFIVKDIAQATQFFGRKMNYSYDLQKSLRDAGFSDESINMFDRPLYHDSSMSDSHKTEFINGIDSVMNRTKRRSILCIQNSTHITRVYNRITVHSRFVIIVDEMHKLGAYKKLGDDTENTSFDNIKDNSYDKMYLNLKVFASKIIGVTATPQIILVSEPSIYTDSLVMVPQGNDYRGIETWTFELLPSDKEEKYIELEGYNNRNCPIKSKVPESFLDTMAKLSDKKPINRINRFGVHDRLPIGLIAKFEVTNDGQHLLLQSMKPDTKAVNENHMKIIKTKWCCIVFNMHGIHLYDDSLRGNTIDITIGEGTPLHKTLTYDDKEGSGEFIFKKEYIQIEDVLHWMWKNGSHDRFPHIVVFTYKSAEEGITFSSKWGDTAETCANWHFPFMYSRMGKTVSAANKEQASGRVNGNHGDFDRKGNQLICTHYDTLVGKEKLIKGVNLHRQMIKDICTMKFDANDGRVIDHIRGYKMFSNRVPTNYYGNTVGANDTIKKIPNPNAILENESFTRHKRVMSTLQMINPEQYGGDKRRKRNIERKEDEISKFSGKYTIVDENMFGTRTKIHIMIKDVCAIIIDNSIMDKNIPIDWINKELQSTKYKDTSLNDIRGIIWTQVRKSDKLVRTDKIVKNSLMYWKEGKDIYVKVSN
jgi:hypothetical protein